MQLSLPSSCRVHTKTTKPYPLKIPTLNPKTQTCVTELATRHQAQRLPRLSDYLPARLPARPPAPRPPHSVPLAIHLLLE